MDNITIHIIDNFDHKDGECAVSLPYQTAAAIAELITQNMLEANKSGTYNEESINHLVHNKTPETIINRTDNGYLIYLTNTDNDVIGCGMIVRKDNLYEAKTLHVHSDYRGRGLAKQICDMPENYLRENGIKTVYIESLKFPGTLAFHHKRNFIQCRGPRPLKYSVYMKKDL